MVDPSSKKDDAFLQCSDGNMQKRQLTLLNSLGSFLKSLDFSHPQHLARIVDYCRQVVAGQFLVYNQFIFERDQIVTKAGCGLPVNFRRRGRLRGRICFEEFVTHGKATSNVPNLQKSTYWNSDPDLKKYGLKSYLGAPVIMTGFPVGSLAVYDTKTEVFTDEDACVIEIIAMVLSFVEEHIKVSEELNRKSAQKKMVADILAKGVADKEIGSSLLNQTEALNSQMIQLSPTAIYNIDLANQRFLMVNEHMARVMGYTEKELLSMKPEELLAPESRKVFRERMIAISAGRPVSNSMDLQVVTKRGELEWGRFHIRHLYDGGRIVGAMVVAHIITEQKKAQEELIKYRNKLEALVEERTEELTEANRQLHKEIERHTQTAKELRLHAERLKEMNTAMRVLLDKRNEERERTEENIRVNLKELIEPYLSRLELSGLSKMQKQLTDLMRMNLDEVFGSSMPEFSSTFLFFTPNELQVVNLIRKGKTTKEMANLLNISTRTVEAYRNTIRKKLGLKNKKVNLRTFLSSKKI